ncbi:MAG: serine protein kinase RIO [Candidatus Asgardarchaeia archaeon]
MKDRDYETKKLRLIEEKLDKLRKKFKDEDDFKTVESVFDTYTLLALYKLFNEGYLDTLHGVISTGKEANVYMGLSPKGEYIAVKIYRTSTLDFKKLLKYIEGDPRFSVIRKKTHKRVYLWAQKEFKNLQLAKNANVRVPTPITVFKNVLLMEFIGERGLPAPLLKDSILQNPEDILQDILLNVYRLYNDAKLVHADLSEYNILLLRDIPYLIDMAQSVSIRHPNALCFLVRDIKNILRFFKDDIGIAVPTVQDVFKEITGVDLNEYTDIC